MEKTTEKKKRGRKPKIKTDISNEITNITDSNVLNNINEQNELENTIKIPKKRGRKPKGGKFVICQQDNETITPAKMNIILHLKCCVNEINKYNFSDLLETFKFSDSKLNELNYTSYDDNIPSTNCTSDNKKINDENDDDDDNINNDNTNNDNTNNDNNNSENSKNNAKDEMKSIWHKLDNLSNFLHTNSICDKKSACFYCTYEFDNNPIYIPKYELNNLYYVYGCFCSPECACGYLMNEEGIDTTARFERYNLLNYLYCKIYSYTKNIKPAPLPYYMLDKYYGNLSIQEYRKLLKNERLLLVMDKPLIRILPELHEDTDDYILNYKGIKAASSNKYTLNQRTCQKSKNDILNKQFNLL